MDSGAAGIIGAVVGAVVGALIVLIPQYIGKLRVTILSATIWFSGPLPMWDANGERSLSTRPEYAIFTIEANIHNSKSYTLSYSDINLEISCKNEKMEIVVDEEDQITRASRTLKVLNIPGNTFVNYKLSCIIRDEYYDFITEHKGEEVYYLCMKSHKNRLIRTLIPNKILVNTSKRSSKKYKG